MVFLLNTMYGGNLPLSAVHANITVNLFFFISSSCHAQLTKFQSFIIKLRKKNDYSLSQIGNADQIPITFDLPSATTITTKGAKSISMTTTGNEKKQIHSDVGMHSRQW
jgi:hypothetical protein